MFDHIHFLHFGDSKEKIADLIQNRHEEVFSHMGLTSKSTIDFLFEGQSYYILQRPYTAEAMENLIYLQSFSYMKTGKEYFTTRSGYDSLLILYTYEGKGELLYDGETFELYPGDVFIIDCRKEQTYRTIGDVWIHSDLHIWGGSASYWYQQVFAGRKNVFRCTREADFQTKLEQILRMMQSADPHRNFKVSMYIEELICYLSECERKDYNEKIPEAVHILQNYLEHNFTRSISLDEMAAFTGVSKYHLLRQFSKYTGFSPKEYMIRLRLMQAAQLLNTTDLSAWKIGQFVGFHSEAHFIQCFRKLYGTTPGAYRSEK